MRPMTEMLKTALLAGALAVALTGVTQTAAEAQGAEKLTVRFTWKRRAAYPIAAKETM